VTLDDCTRENGCLLILPGSHRWPILDRHQDGVFVGAIDIEREGVDVPGAVPVTVGAGDITLHRARMLHASAPNTSSLPRRLLLLQLAAVDAWPVMGVSDLVQFNSWVLRDERTTRYRVAEMDIRLPLPKHERQGRIYEIQTALRPKRFAALRSKSLDSRADTERMQGSTSNGSHSPLGERRDVDRKSNPHEEASEGLGEVFSVGWQQTDAFPAC